MTERIVRMNLRSGDVDIIALNDALSELSCAGLYCELAPLLRDGESVRLPTGLAYRTLASLTERNVESLPPSAVN